MSQFAVTVVYLHLQISNLLTLTQYSELVLKVANAHPLRHYSLLQELILHQQVFLFANGSIQLKYLPLLVLHHHWHLLQIVPIPNEFNAVQIATRRVKILFHFLVTDP